MLSMAEAKKRTVGPSGNFLNELRPLPPGIQEVDLAMNQLDSVLTTEARYLIQTVDGQQLACARNNAQPFRIDPGQVSRPILNTFTSDPEILWPLAGHETIVGFVAGWIHGRSHECPGLRTVAGELDSG